MLIVKVFLNFSALIKPPFLQLIMCFVAEGRSAGFLAVVKPGLARLSNREWITTHDTKEVKEHV